MKLIASCFAKLQLFLYKLVMYTENKNIRKRGCYVFITCKIFIFIELMIVLVYVKTEVCRQQDQSKIYDIRITVNSVTILF